MRRLYMTIGLMTLLALLLVACGGGDDADERHLDSLDAPVEALDGVCVEVSHAPGQRIYRCSYDDGTICMVMRSTYDGSPALSCNWSQSE